MAVALTYVVIAGANILPLRLRAFALNGTVWKSSDFRNGQLDVQQRKRRGD